MSIPESVAGSSYTWYARLAPMYIVLLPAAIAISVWFPDTPVLERIPSPEAFFLATRSAWAIAAKKLMR